MRNKHYYDDSDDMIERVRKAREAFEKKIRAFQGVDWPYYTERVIKGQLKKEDAPGQVPAPTSNPQEPSSVTAGADQVPITNNAEQKNPDETAAWWAAKRAAQKSTPDIHQADEPSADTEKAGQ